MHVTVLSPCIHNSVISVRAEISTTLSFEHNQCHTVPPPATPIPHSPSLTLFVSGERLLQDCLLQFSSLYGQPYQ